MAESDTKASGDIDATLQHVHASLVNVQETIRFIDTKVAGGMGFTAIVLGLMISRHVLISQLAMSGVGCLGCWILLCVLLAASVVFLYRAVLFASKTLWPKQTELDELKGKTWVLFPLSSKNGDEEALYRTMKERLENGMTKEDIIAEYTEQLTVNGHILSQKFASCRKMFAAIWQFCLAMLALGGLSLLLTVIDQSGIGEFLEQRKPCSCCKMQPQVVRSNTEQGTTMNESSDDKGTTGEETEEKDNADKTNERNDAVDAGGLSK